MICKDNSVQMAKTKRFIIMAQATTAQSRWGEKKKMPHLTAKCTNEWR